MPFARKTNVSIRSGNDASVLDLEAATACAAMIYLACAYAAGDCLFASRLASFSRRLPWWWMVAAGGWMIAPGGCWRPSVTKANAAGGWMIASEGV